MIRNCAWRNRKERPPNNNAFVRSANVERKLKSFIHCSQVGTNTNSSRQIYLVLKQTLLKYRNAHRAKIIIWKKNIENYKLNTRHQQFRNTKDKTTKKEKHQFDEYIMHTRKVNFHFWRLFRVWVNLMNNFSDNFRFVKKTIICLRFKTCIMHKTATSDIRLKPDTTWVLRCLKGSTYYLTVCNFSKS